MLRMARGVDFTNWTNVPLTMDVDMPEVVTFKAGLEDVVISVTYCSTSLMHSGICSW